MKLVSMKMTKADREKRKETCISESPDMPVYPWGLSITLDEEALAKLGIKELPKTETPLVLVANVDVTAVSSNDTIGGGERRSVSLQITDLALEPVASPEASKKLYDKE